jgi:hypothetical protein
MKRSTLLAATVVLAIGNGTAAAVEHGSAEELLLDCTYGSHNPNSMQELACVAKAEAIQSTVFALKLLDGRIEMPFCLPKTAWSNDRAVGEFVEYATAHPDEQNKPAELIFIQALAVSFPPQRGCY